MGEGAGDGRRFSAGGRTSTDVPAAELSNNRCRCLLSHPLTGALPAWKSIGSSMLSGALASIVGTPFDVALVRMQSDSLKPVAGALRCCVSVGSCGSSYTLPLPD